MIILILVGLIIILLLIILLNKHIEHFINQSSYFDNMTSLDLIARGMKTREEYRIYYQNNIIKFTPIELKQLKKLQDYISKKLIQYNFHDLNNIPWKIIKVNNNIEMGFPHTLADTIILSSNFFNMSEELQCKVLLHEKYHVYQRKYPSVIAKIIKDWGLIEYEVPNQVLNKRRNNPDLPTPFKVYGPSNPQYYIIQLYNNPSPTSLYDSSVCAFTPSNKRIPIEQIVKDLNIPSYVKQLEHPYEITACIIPELIIDDREPTTHIESLILSSAATKTFLSS